MRYQERRYWETRYKRGRGSGDVEPDEHDRLVERIVAVATALHVHSLLDVGIGDGVLASQISSRLPNVDYHGIDISEWSIKRARSQLPESVSLEVADLVERPVERREMVVCLNVHYHIATKRRADRLIRNLCMSTDKALFILTWNHRVLEKGKLAPHCHYHPISVANYPSFQLEAEEELVSCRHKTLYLLHRTQRESKDACGAPNP